MTLPRLRDNIAALGALQFATYVIPLITIPYLTRVLGLEAYGKLVFTQVLLTYVVLITDYGFSLTATRKISANRSNKHYISRVFWATWGAQWLLAALSGIAFFALVSIIPVLRTNAVVYYVGFSLVVGNLLFPVWLFQGLEKMKEVAIINACSRLLALFPLFFLVKKPDDLIWVLALSGAGAGISGIASLFWIKNKKLIYWTGTSFRQILAALADGRSVFLSKISISLYTIFIPIALGFTYGTTVVGYFVLADKLKKVVQGLFTPITQALYPRMSLLYSNDPRGASGLIKRSAKIVVTASALASLGLFLSATELVSIIAGDEFLPAASILKWLAFLPLITNISNLLGVQIMLPNHLTKQYNMIIASAAVISLIVIMPMINWMGIYGAAIVSLNIEIYVAILMGLFLFRKGYFRPTIS